MHHRDKSAFEVSNPQAGMLNSALSSRIMLATGSPWAFYYLDSDWKSSISLYAHAYTLLAKDLMQQMIS